jgi:type VI secretion system protein ImpK
MNPPASPTADGPTTRPGDLAVALQEAFTVAVRLRTNRQVAADAASFRTHVKSLLGAADREARARGFDAESVKLAVYAYIAFLDETVLNSTQAMFADWTRQPLQEEIFGEHVAGENFFRFLGDLLGRQDSAPLADLLEVYQLCLLLGFRGKYGASDPSSLQGLMLSVQQKIQRIRGTRAGFPPTWRLPQDEVVELSADPWMRRLGFFAGAAFVLAAALFATFKLLLVSNASGLRDAVARLMSGG